MTEKYIRQNLGLRHGIFDAVTDVSTAFGGCYNNAMVPVQAPHAPVAYTTIEEGIRFLHLPNSTYESEQPVNTAPIAPDRAFTSGEPTEVVVRAVTHCISLSFPFGIRLLRSLVAGKHSRSVACWIQSLAIYLRWRSP